jgi:peptide/nickel transport system ATP-binding protein
MYTIGAQINESCLLHITKNKKEARGITIDMMKKVGIANAERRYNQYPHEFSGGMLQRALIAMALICRPSLLIADEPTTALDVTIQAQILDLMKHLQAEFKMAILFITHDLGIMAGMCDRLAVMYLGKIVEEAPVREIYKNPRHPYTQGLIASVHKMGTHNQNKLFSIEGTVPLALNLSETCGFRGRCAKCIEGRCDRGEPPLIDLGGGHRVSCFLYGGEQHE